MTRILYAFVAAAAVMLGFGIAPAFAQTRVFVSGAGSDANPCSLSAPCRSFQQAHSTVLAGGEIVALDAAGYGTLTITKAVTVTAIGIEASITSNSNNSGTAITINAGANDVVTIRGLTVISGFAASGNGILISAAKSVTIRDCSITGFPGVGIGVVPSANLDLELSDVSANNNGGDGLDLLPSGTGRLTVLVTDSQFNGNTTNGVDVDGSESTGTIAATLNITAAANHGSGVFVNSAAAKARAVVMVTGAKLANNTLLGLWGNTSNVTVLVDRTQISGNGTGWQATSIAVVDSYKNNEVNGNGNDGLNGVTQISSQ